MRWLSEHSVKVDTLRCAVVDVGRLWRPAEYGVGFGERDLSRAIEGVQSAPTVKLKEWLRGGSTPGAPICLLHRSAHDPVVRRTEAELRKRTHCRRFRDRRDSYQALGWKAAGRFVSVREDLREPPETRGRKPNEVPVSTFSCAGHHLDPESPVENLPFYNRALQREPAQANDFGIVSVCGPSIATDSQFSTQKNGGPDGAAVFFLRH